MTKQWDQLKGVPLGVDIAISDLKKGEFYKHGRDPKEILGDWE